MIYTAIADGDDEVAKQHSGCCVVRMRKDLTHIKPTVEQINDFHKYIVPLFEGHENLLMQQELYKLSPELVRECNELLLDMESSTPKSNRKRSKKRQAVYHPSFEEEQFGVLMPNMRPLLAGLMIEFKPKWLVQSPSAPPDAKRCRTCALNAHRRAAGTPRGRGDSGFCPLDLLSDDVTILKTALSNIWPSTDTLDAFLEIFQRSVQPGVKHLHDLQQMHNNVGLHDFEDPDGKDFSIAMALRDCSMFLKLATEVESDNALTLVSAKFADLDLKSSDGGKVEKWANIESALVEEGWYSGRDSVDNICVLNR